MVIRQVAVYHDFDLASGHSLRLFLKGNKVIKQRVEEAIRESQSNEKFSPGLIQALSESLMPHLTLFNWANENWRCYISHMEDQLHEVAIKTQLAEAELCGYSSTMRGVRTAPRRAVSTAVKMQENVRQASSVLFMGRLRQPILPLTAGIINRTNTDSVRSVQDGTLKYTGRTILGPSWDRCFTGHRARNPSSSEKKGQIRPELPNITIPDHEASRVRETDRASMSPSDYVRMVQMLRLSMEQLQNIEDNAREALLVLKLNVDVLLRLREHYEYVTTYRHFPQNLDIIWHDKLSEFFRTITSTSRDYLMLQASIEALLDLLSNHKSIVCSGSRDTGILRVDPLYIASALAHGDMLQTQVSADQMNRLTEEMHHGALKTRQEAVSMRVITLVTLFFLPGTFIAVSNLLNYSYLGTDSRKTFLSTDVVGFDQGSRPSQINGLSLYFALVLPLTVLTFCAWYVMCLLAREQNHSEHRE